MGRNEVTMAGDENNVKWIVSETEKHWRGKEPKCCVERYCTTGNATCKNLNLERCHSNGFPNSEMVTCKCEMQKEVSRDRCNYL